MLSEHARREAARRGIAEDIVLQVAAGPGQVEPLRSGREVRQSLIGFPPDDKVYLVRVVVDLEPQLEVVVTV